MKLDQLQIDFLCAAHHRKNVVIEPTMEGAKPYYALLADLEGVALRYKIALFEYSERGFVLAEIVQKALNAMK